jgi:hypothetical protein
MAAPRNLYLYFHLRAIVIYPLYMLLVISEMLHLRILYGYTIPLYRLSENSKAMNN